MHSQFAGKEEGLPRISKLKCNIENDLFLRTVYESFRGFKARTKVEEGQRIVDETVRHSKKLSQQRENQGSPTESIYQILQEHGRAEVQMDVFSKN